MLPKKKNENIEDKKADILPVLDSNQIQELFNARCRDLKIIAKSKQFDKFNESIQERCVNRKLNLTNMFLGPMTAQLISHWMILNRIDVTHLLLG